MQTRQVAVDMDRPENETITRRHGASAATRAFGLMAGTALLVVGIGIGIRHWMIAGLTWGSVLGSVALLTGILGVGFGVIGVGEGRSTATGAALRVMVVLAVSTSIWTLSPALLATMLPHVPSGSLTPADLGLSAEAVTYPAADGVVLAGWYIPSVGPPVVLRHGAGADASKVLGQAAALVDHGFTVLVTDARGHGRSEGRPMEFGWFGDLDIVAAVDFLAGRKDISVSGVAVVGLSMGGEEAIGASARDGRIVAVVAEGATARTADDKAWLAEAYGLRGAIQVWLERVQYGLTDLLTSASRPTVLRSAVAESAPTPVLLIAAGERADEVRAADHIRGGSPGSVVVWAVPRSQHAAGFDTDPDEWVRVVTSFIGDAFGR